MRNETEVEQVPHGILAIEDAARLRLEFLPRNRVFIRAFMLVWLAGWSAAGIALLLEFFSGGVVRMRSGGEAPPEFLAIFMVIWLVSWLSGIATVIWLFFGREVVEITSGVLSKFVLAPVFKFRWDYNLGPTTEFRAVVPSQRERGAGRIPLPHIQNGRVEFDDGPKKISFGVDLEPNEATYVARLLTTKLKHFRSTR